MKTTSSPTTSAPTSTTATSRSGSPRQQTPKQGLPSRPDHQRQQQQPESEAALPPIDLGKRRTRRGFTTQQVLGLLQAEAPEFFDRAEVVGQWVWITFKDKQPRDITARLAEFGFHWNNKRGSWQHPCGQLRPGTEHDPRQKYQAYFPADMRAA